MFMEHVDEKGTEQFFRKTSFIPKEKDISLLELILNNCDFSVPEEFPQQLKEAAMGSPVIVNIYMKYFKELALGPECPLPNT